MRTGSGLDLALAVWRRRKWLMLPIFLIPLAATVGLARTLPDIYEATATVLVGSRQQDPGRPMDASALSELEIRLRTVSEQVLSRARLAELITRFDLYPDARPQATVDDRVERLRRDIRLDFKQAKDDFTWRTTTIGVAISFRNRNPEVVAAVTNALAQLFVAENAQIREQYAIATVELLRVQVEEAKRRLEDLARVRTPRGLDYDLAVQRYRSALERYEEARIAQRMEAQLRDAQLHVLDPAVLPHEPAAPRRAVILLMGLLLSAGAAVGAGVLAETRDTSFHTVDDLRTFTRVPVLVTIPLIVTRVDAWRRVARIATGALVVGVAAAAAATASSHLAQGNELLVRFLTPDRF